ncbi:MAG: phosphoglycerate dehydrogenase, partial [Oscillospiraceae bacterium]|nr:phosphoglycerate dehydrogenase [Oscillospiraceae bacterium]
MLCKEAWELLEENGHEVIFDPARPFPAYSYEELQGIIGDIDAAIIGMDEYNEDVFRIAPRLKAVAKFGV